MTEEEMRKFLADNGDLIAERVRDQMVEQIAETYRWQVPDTINKVVTEFMSDKIAPAIREHLQSNEGPIIAAAITATDQITDKLSEVMVTKAVENMNGYRFGQTIEALFK
ncbi:hypothetical protein [Roseibium alexandrii]|uniref:Uncharacterized protein n=1 Tax=Roseibium alexandrii TaxID=388408 RepID=A0A0M7A082_9HYPH|nr:hypothetical protein [Roseibium alexandrii]CTQ67204.1 hypothetical protein LAX5112_01265 [Roseibium alexandrii]